MSVNQTPSNKSQSEHSDIPLLEWIVAGLGLLIVGSTLSLMVYEAVAGDHSPPDVTFSVTSITKVGQGYRVDFTAYNQGGKTASEVQVEGKVSGPDAETAEGTFDFIPPHSSRRGGLFFENDPAGGKLGFRTISYREP